MSVLLSRWAKLYNLTPAERALEPAIAALGIPYRVQHPLWALGLFPDFVLLDARVVIEVDDPSHRRKAAADAERTAKLNRAGWRVARCTNEEAMADPVGTINRLMTELGLPQRVPRLTGAVLTGTPLGETNGTATDS